MLGSVGISDPSNPFGAAITEQRKLIMSGKRSSLDVNRYAALLQNDGQCKAARQVLDGYLAQFPLDLTAKYLKSLIVLSDGDYTEGFRLYENRFAVYPAKSAVNNICPRWDGTPTDQQVLVWQEGGFGDVINFGARYFPEVLRRCPNAKLLVDPSIIDLLISSGIPADRLPRSRDDFDKDLSNSLQCSIQSLMLVLQVTRASVTGKPHIHVGQAAVEHWRKRMADKPKIGFCWKGNPDHERDTTRSLTDEEAFEFGERHELFSLMQSHLTGVDNWTDTAAIISHLDLVISVDTAVAHLAAAMGKPTWLLLPIDFDWRWMHTRKRSHWYDSAWLFRCGKHGDWRGVLARVTKALNNHVRQ